MARPPLKKMLPDPVFEMAPPLVVSSVPATALFRLKLASPSKDMVSLTAQNEWKNATGVVDARADSPHAAERSLLTRSMEPGGGPGRRRARRRAIMLPSQCFPATTGAMDGQLRSFPMPMHLHNRVKARTRTRTSGGVRDSILTRHRVSPALVRRLHSLRILTLIIVLTNEPLASAWAFPPTQMVPRCLVLSMLQGNVPLRRGCLLLPARSHWGTPRQQHLPSRPMS